MNEGDRESDRDTAPVRTRKTRPRKTDHMELIDSIKSSIPYCLYIASRIMTSSYYPTVQWTGVHIAESFVLLELWRDEPLSQKELARRLKVNHASIGQILRRLERDELVRRWQLPDDRRVMMVETTEKGAAPRDAVLTSALQLSKEFEAVLGKEDAEHMKRILGAITQHYGKASR